jgi:histidyl-tRNA synthetase
MSFAGAAGLRGTVNPVDRNRSHPIRLPVPMETLKAVPGTHDLLPAETERWDRVRDVVAGKMAEYAYGRIETPHFETADLFARSVGAETDIVQKEMYVFEDRGGRQLALRPEGTAGVVRAYIEARLDNQRPLSKLWYWGPMFRAERPQKGRQRQFWQFGVEAIGAAGPQIDAEQIALATRITAALGLADLTLRLNSIGDASCRPAYRDKLRGFLRAVRQELCANCRRRLETNPLRVLDCKEESCRALTANAPLSLDHLCLDCATHLEGVRDTLDQLGVPYTMDGRIVRGLDYYQRTAFELESASLGAQNSVLGGGRYDGLVASLGGPDVAGVGWAAGIERILLALGDAESAAGGLHAFVVGFPATRAEALALTEKLRQQGLRSETDLLHRSMKAQLREAVRSGAAFAVLLGPDEWSRGNVTLRDLQAGKQEELSLAAAIARMIGP